MEFSEQVLLLQVGRFRERDIWIRFLSPTRGVLSAFAFGAGNSRRRFVGCLDILNSVLVRVTSMGRGTYLALQEGELARGLRRLRTDWGRLGMAANCARFLQAFGIGPDGAANAYFLLEGTILLLENAEAVSPLLPLFFRARLALDQGYDLDFGRCASCGGAFSASFFPHNTALQLDAVRMAGSSPLPGRPTSNMLEEGSLLSGGGMFFPEAGQLLCRSCAARFPALSVSSGRSQALGEEALACLCRIRAQTPEQWAGISLSSEARSQCARAVEAFIEAHIGLSWEKGRFIRR